MVTQLFGLGKSDTTEPQISSPTCLLHFDNPAYAQLNCLWTQNIFVRPKSTSI